ncbi:MAG: ABC transporter substrate-binding protein, partial [Chloroflexota bacterium]
WSLVRNPNYFKPGHPYLDKVETIAIVDDNTNVASFLTGKTAYLSYSGYTPEQYMGSWNRLANDGKINIYSNPATGGSVFGVWMVISKPPFDNLKLRQAVNLAADRKRLGAAAYGTVNPPRPQLIFVTADSPLSTRADSGIWDAVPGWGTGAKKAQEAEQAKQLVKDAGYPNGLDIELIARSDTLYNVRGAEELQQHLGPIGIRTTIKLLAPSVITERMSRLDYAIQVYTYAQLIGDPDEVLNHFITGGSRNNTGYSNPEVDKLFIQQSGELDVAKRKQLFRQLEDLIVVKDVAYVPAPGPVPFAFWWKWLQGFDLGVRSSLYTPAGPARADRLWLEG